MSKIHYPPNKYTHPRAREPAGVPVPVTAFIIFATPATPIVENQYVSVLNPLFWPRGCKAWREVRGRSAYQPLSPVPTPRPCVGRAGRCALGRPALALCRGPLARLCWAVVASGPPWVPLLLLPPRLWWPCPCACARRAGGRLRASYGEGCVCLAGGMFTEFDTRGQHRAGFTTSGFYAMKFTEGVTSYTQSIPPIILHQNSP